MRPLRQTPKIVELEEQYGKPIRQITIEAIERAHTIAGAAELLGIPLGTFYYWVQRLNIATDTRTVTRIAS